MDKLVLYVLNGYVYKDGYGYINLAFSTSKSKIKEEKEKWIHDLNHVKGCENYKCKLIPDYRDWDSKICPYCKDPQKVVIEYNQYEDFKIEKVEVNS